jgi:predicted small integral membrane protein
MVVLPRLARMLNRPGIAALLGLILIAVAIIGLVTDDIRTLWAVIILVVGAINVLRAIPHQDAPDLPNRP